MIIVLRPHVTEEEIALVVEHVRELGLTPHVSRGVTRTIIGCIGDEDRLREVPMMSFPAVESVLAVEKPYKLAAREFAAGDTLVHLGQAAIGDGAVHVIAGPCSVEGPEMLRQTAESVKAAGAVGLRGGAFKPRTSPYSFQGLGLDALDMLARRPRDHGPAGHHRNARYASRCRGRPKGRLRPGRSAQHAELRAAQGVGTCGKPVLLKRGMSATLEDLLLAAEYVLARGNTQVMLCERGIRTFDRTLATRSTSTPCLTSSGRRICRCWWIPATRAGGAIWSRRSRSQPSRPVRMVW